MSEARRPSQKTMADIRFVCTYIQSKVQEHGLWTEEMSHQQLTECFDEVATIENGLLSANNRRAYTQWRTACRFIRRIVRANDQQANV